MIPFPGSPSDFTYAQYFLKIRTHSTVKRGFKGLGCRHLEYIFNEKTKKQFCGSHIIYTHACVHICILPFIYVCLMFITMVAANSTDSSLCVSHALKLFAYFN